MGEAAGAPVSRLQRLQRQRQRANQRSARSTTTTVAATVSTGETANVADKKTTTVVINESTNSNGDNVKKNINPVVAKNNLSSKYSGSSGKYSTYNRGNSSVKDSATINKSSSKTTNAKSLTSRTSTINKETSRSTASSSPDKSPSNNRTRVGSNYTLPKKTNSVKSLTNKSSMETKETLRPMTRSSSPLPIPPQANIGRRGNASAMTTTNSSRRAAGLGKKALQLSRSSSSTSSMPRAHDENDGDDGGVEIMSPSTATILASKPAKVDSISSRVRITVNEPLPPPPPLISPHRPPPWPSSPPEPLAESRHSSRSSSAGSSISPPPSSPSKSNAERLSSRRSSNGSASVSSPTPSSPKPPAQSSSNGSSSKSKDSWFQYTSGTQSGTSSKFQSAKKKPIAPGGAASSVSERPRTMEELQFYSDRYGATSKRSGGGDAGTSARFSKEKSRFLNGQSLGQSSQDPVVMVDEIGNYEVSTLSSIGNSSVESNGAVRSKETMPGYHPQRRSSSPKQGSHYVPPTRKNGTRKSFCSQRSAQSDEETNNRNDATENNKKNMWKEMTPVKSNENKFQTMPRAHSYSKPTQTPSTPPRTTSMPNNTKNDAMAPPWAKRSGNKDNNHKPTKSKLLPNPVNKVGNAASIPPLPKKKKPQNKSISIRHGGTPVWIHASILAEHGDFGGDDEWEWVRGYLDGGNESDDSLAVTVDEPYSSASGSTFTMPKRCNDGARILMGNGWWSVPSSPSPSPTCVSQSVDLTSDADVLGMPPGDLVEMTHLHEPAIVHALRTRYEKDIIYTNTGAILLALNPFKKLDHLYTREMMELYWREDGGSGSGSSSGGGEEGRETKEKLPPHAYAVAENAYSSMIRSLEERDAHRLESASKGKLSPCNQSILVSGESGAGKTVTTKIVMRYLSILSQRNSDGNMDANEHDGPSVEMQVLQSNPVLESFGNARTIRNDNSSRFGKFIEMSFQARKDDACGQRGSLLGAKIDFYLLEKVRLVSVNPGERNYHIFYELLSPHGMRVSDKQRYKLTSSFGKGRTKLTVHDFNMTSISGTFDRRDGVDDSETYGELRTAMNTVGFSFDEQDGIFSVVSALLHASNLKFVNNGNDECLVYDQDGTSAAVSSLLGVSEDSLKMALTTIILEARGERLLKQLSTSQAEKALEATVKAAYGSLFAYLVTRINKSIEVQGEFGCETGGMDQGGDDVATVGVLDIFGFESFETNSFEQLCINYCNEALQQQFNRFVFKAEQAEYEYEGIEWSNIEFPDNQEALDLIEAKRLGIFAVLDEQCRLPRRTDQTFAKSVYDTCESNSYFEASRMQRSKGRFAIIHYAGSVTYDSDSFILKNKDELPKSASDLLASSTIPFVSELARILGGNDSCRPAPSGDSGCAPLKRNSSTLTRITVSGQFASQLKGLRARIETTEPHYIRCLKPNDRLVANHFDESLIAHQLNCAGVLPAMKIARAGFAMRYLHTAFIQRYRPIVGLELRHSARKLSDHQATCQILIGLLSERLESEMKQKTQPNTKIDDVADIVSWGVQVGKSKVFLRSAASEALEVLRTATVNEAAIILQAKARTFLCQNRFYLTLGSVLTLQCFARKLVASLRVRRLRFTERAIAIQKQWRSYYAWYLYQNMMLVASAVQRFWRGRKVRERFVRIKRYRSAIVIQSAWRSHVFQQFHQELRNAAITIQCSVRVCISTRKLKQLKREAKDVQSIALERDKLRMEMRRMKQELEQIKNRNKNTTILRSDSWTTAKTSASQEEKILNLSKECAKKDEELQMLRQEVESLRGSGRSVPSTLPLTVTVDSELPSPKPTRFSPVELSLMPSGEISLTKSVEKVHTSPIRPAPFSPVDMSRIPSEESSLTKNVALLPNSPCLLDAEVEGLPQLECSQISFPNSSIDNSDYNINVSVLNQTTESSFIDRVKIDELPFHQAVQNDDKRMLFEEIQSTSDIDLGINSADSKGRTPLHIAAQCSNTELVNVLLTHNSVVNTQDFSGNTALHLADSPEITQILLDGGINPNIPNMDGLCSLHFAVKRRDFTSVKHLLLHGADVNNADDEWWYTSLHLVAHADSPTPNKSSRSLRGPIAELLCEAKVPSVPDLNYQDRDGNTPLHHASSLVEEDAGVLMSLFLEHGSCPKISNHRGQTPVHLLCHNNAARQFGFYHEALQIMLDKGADPNATSLSGCTALHLALYHQDVEAAALLVRHGAQVNMKWKKPQKWETSWTDMGTDDVLPLDMLEDVRSLHALLTEISVPQIPAFRRARCMHCKEKFGMFARHHNCTHCGRSVCGRCCTASLRRSYFPTLRNEEGNDGLFKVCSLCEPILLSRIDRVPATIVSAVGCDQSSLGTISM